MKEKEHLEIRQRSEIFDGPASGVWTFRELLEKVRGSRNWDPHNEMKPIKLKPGMKQRKESYGWRVGYFHIANIELINMWSWEGIVTGQLGGQSLNWGQEITNTSTVIIQNWKQIVWRVLVLDSYYHPWIMWRISLKFDGVLRRSGANCGWKHASLKRGSRYKE